MKSESSGDWQKEKDQKPPKKKGSKEKSSKERRFFIKIPKKKENSKTKASKKLNPSKKKKGFKRNPLKREFHKGFNALVSEHIIQIHAIESAVFEFSPHKGIVVRVDGRDFKP
ncbi:hypothetical protein ID0475_00410 [Helicobacter pylori]